MKDKLQLNNQHISTIYNDIVKKQSHTKFITDWNHTHDVIIRKNNDTDADTNVKADTITQWFF